MGGLDSAIKRIDLLANRRYVPIDRIVRDLGQPRRRYEKNSFEDLVNSFEHDGQFSFPLVEAVTGREYRAYTKSLEDIDESEKGKVLKGIKDDEAYFFLVVGHRRTDAAKKAGYEELGVDVLENRLSLLQRRLVQIDEDSQLPLKSWRKAEELVRLYRFENADRKLEGKSAISQSKFSAHYGLSEESVRNALRYVKLPERVKKFVESEQLNYEKAVVIALLPTKKEQYEYALRYGAGAYDTLKEKVYLRILKIAEKNPKLAEKKGLMPIARALKASECRGKGKRPFDEEGNLTCEALNCNGLIREKRDLVRQIRDEIFRSLRIGRIDHEYMKNIKSIADENSSAILESIGLLESKLREFTDYMEDLSKSRPVNGRRVHYYTIGEVIELIEREARPKLRNLSRVAVVREVPLDLIDPDPENPRGKVTEEEIDDLAAAIRRDGRLLNPLLAEKKRKRYKLIAGERRYHSSKRAGLEKVHVIELQNLNPKARLWLQKNENTQQPFSKSERARALSQIYDLAGADCVDELIELLQISRRTGLDELRYEKEISKQVKILVEEGLIPYSSAILFTEKALRIEGRPLDADQQLEVSYIAVIKGEVNKSDFRQRIQNFIDKAAVNKRQESFFDASPDRDFLYRKHVKDFELLLAGLKQNIEIWCRNEKIIRDVISKDKYIMNYLCMIKSLILEADKKSKKTAKSAG